MKNIILLILFLIMTFVLNIIFYYNSSDYRDFLRGLKNEEVHMKNNSSVDNRDLVNMKEKIENSKNNEQKDDDFLIADKQEALQKSREDINNEPQKPEIKLGKNYTDILEKFSEYDLEKLELNTNLFDITNEYPDTYFEYYSRDMTLYFFPSKSYSEVLDIFMVLGLELPYSINETNSFGDKSFFINLNEDIDDGIVRLVVKNKSVVFGLKIRKNEYNGIKKILENLK